MEQIIDGQLNTLALNALNIVEASANLAKISAALTGHECVMLDLSSCDDIDTAGLQLLAAIRLDPMYQNRVKWTGLSAEFHAKAERLGLSTLLAQAV